MNAPIEMFWTFYYDTKLLVDKKVTIWKKKKINNDKKRSHGWVIRNRETIHQSWDVKMLGNGSWDTFLHVRALSLSPILSLYLLSWCSHGHPPLSVIHISSSYSITWLMFHTYLWDGCVTINACLVSYKIDIRIAYWTSP